MKKNLLLITLTILQQFAFSQVNNSMLQIKEHFDKTHNIFLYNKYQPYSLSTNNSPSVIADNLGDGWSYVMESELQMYKTTGDRGYLVRFANEAINAQEKRLDKLGISPFPIWIGTAQIYQNGLIIWPMAHFWFLVHLEDPSLGALPILQHGKIANNAFGATFNTYHDFGFWLRGKVEETLDYYTYDPIGWWAGDQIGYTNVPLQNNPQAAVINKQFAWGNSLLYPWITNPNTENIKLAVEGTIIATEVQVKLRSAWPDYVFDSNYQLMSLKEVEAYISKYKHLPGLKSALQVSQEVISLGEMSGVLLKKIEELTLYTIQQDKKLETLEQEMNELKNQMEGR